MGRFNRWLYLLMLAAVPLPLHAQAGGTITGRVIEASTGASTAVSPIAGAQVFIPGTNLGTTTDQDGRFTLSNVPVGSHVLRATAVGHAQANRPVTVAAGRTAQVDIRLESQAVELQELVVTGVAGPTSKAKVPFTIAKLDNTELNQAVSTNAASALAGKVAGAKVISGSGRPGEAPSIMLRGPKSINASGRSQEPLYIVDGVILGSEAVDISPEDIESIEVVKGAAASSLYGSRAANGVIQIKTKRGASITDDHVQYTVRSEYGQSALPNEFPLARFNHLLMTSNGQQFVDADGNACDYLSCSSVALAGQAADGGAATEWNTYQNQLWPGRTYDQVERFFTGGAFNQNYLAASGRSGATNFHVSWNNLTDEGIEIGHKGLRRNNFRVNLDQAVQENVQVSASAFYSRSEEDPRQGGLFDLTRMQPGVDLTACADDPGKSCLDDPMGLIVLADPQNPESSNPLYDMLNQDWDRKKGRFLGSADIRWSPIDWFDLSTNVSYDRLDQTTTSYYPKGYETTTPNATVNNGFLDQSDYRAEAFNASVTGTFTHDFGDNVRNRTQLRYLFEQQDRNSVYTRGYDFSVGGLETFNNTSPDNFLSTSSKQPIRADGYYAITNFDILDRYVIDALVRNDGSSLFGPDERRQWYYRGAVAWRLSQEPWFTLPGVDEFKLRYAYGTAGNRPNFEAQYETYSVSNGVITPITLGNTKLKPEFSREQEVGLDASFLNQAVTLGLTYANTRTTDQILPVPLPAYTGFQSQWQNAGTLESNTWEASLDARLLERGRFTWTGRVLFDRTRSRITELNVPTFTYGIPSDQGLEDVYFAREGEQLGTFYGVKVAQSCADLPSDVSCNDFVVNDDGWLVWAPGGLSNPQWGTAAPFTVAGKTPMWGTPFRGYCEDATTGEQTLHCPLGNSLPDYSLNFSSTINFGGLSLYGLFGGEQGFSIYNLPLQWAVFRNTADLCDQGGVPEAQAKPLGYCNALYGVSGLIPSTSFVEDGSYWKMREASIRYHIGESTLGRLPGISTFSGATLSLTGRNLFTITNYRGYDPEVGRAGGEVGSASLARVEGYTYPNFRTWTLGVELNF